MVTGVETAGLVLAAFPLIVKGLEAYIEGIQKIKQLRDFRKLLKSYSVQLSTQQAIFQQTFQVLLEAADIEPDQLQIMTV